MDAIELDVFYDYNCPFVYRAAKMLQAVASRDEDRVTIRWRYFSLTQVNHRSDDPRDEWTVWSAPDSEHVRGRLAFKAAEAARRQGRFDDLHAALLDARHAGKLDIENTEVVEDVARRAGLDLDRFRGDLSDPEILAALARDHAEARELHGVFGTPTLVSPRGSAYLRLARVLDPGEAPRVFERVLEMIAGEPAVLEIKRPVRPAAI